MLGLFAEHAIAADKVLKSVAQIYNWICSLVI